MKQPVVFERAAVNERVCSRYPFCPSLSRRDIARHIVSHPWPAGTTIDDAITFSAAAHVRHKLFGYSTMMNEAGISRQEARRAISPSVAKVIASWTRPASPTPPSS